MGHCCLWIKLKKNLAQFQFDVARPSEVHRDALRANQQHWGIVSLVQHNPHAGRVRHARRWYIFEAEVQVVKCTSRINLLIVCKNSND